MYDPIFLIPYLLSLSMRWWHIVLFVIVASVGIGAFAWFSHASFSSQDVRLTLEGAGEIAKKVGPLREALRIANGELNIARAELAAAERELAAKQAELDNMQEQVMWISLRRFLL